MGFRSHSTQSDLLANETGIKGATQAVHYPFFIYIIGLTSLIMLSLAVICNGGYDPLPAAGVVILYITSLYLIPFRKNSIFLPAIVILSFVFYLIVALLIDNEPVSDFLTQYSSAKAFIHGTYTAYENAYYQKWGGQIGWSLLMGLFMLINDSVITVKVAQCACSSAILALVYHLTKQIGSVGSAQRACLLCASFPTFALWSGVLSNQIFSTFFCLIGLVVLCRLHPNQKALSQIALIILTGCSLALANFIRPDGIVFIVSACIAVFLNNHTKQTAKRLVHATLLGVTYVLLGILLSAIVSATICSTGTGTHDFLWKFAVGTNNQSSGAWDKSVVERVGSYENQGYSHDEAELIVIEENLESKSIVLETIIKKNNCLWWDNPLHFALGSKRSKIPYLYQWLYSLDKGFVMLLVIGSAITICNLFRKSTSNEEWLVRRSKRPLVLYGTIAILTFTLLVYQGIEVQPRYLYSCYVFMTILAGMGLTSLFDKLQNNRTLEGPAR